MSQICDDRHISVGDHQGEMEPPILSPDNYNLLPAKTANMFPSDSSAPHHQPSVSMFTFHFPICGVVVF